MADDLIAKFSEEVQTALRPHLVPAECRRIACFDADGTLWGEDIGEAFFRWLIAGKILPSQRPDQAVWEEYEGRVAENRSAGYAWAVAMMAGLEEADIVRWSQQMAAAWPNYRLAMAGMVAAMKAVDIEVWIVSASNRWTVTAAAPKMGFTANRVVGMAVSVVNGVLTDHAVQPLICNAGKVDGIDRYIGQRPLIAVGDSMGDFELLESAQVPIVIGRHDKPGAELLAVARERGWPVHLF